MTDTELYELIDLTRGGIDDAIESALDRFGISDDPDLLDAISRSVMLSISVTALSTLKELNNSLKDLRDLKHRQEVIIRIITEEKNSISSENLKLRSENKSLRSKMEDTERKSDVSDEMNHLTDSMTSLLSSMRGLEITSLRVIDSKD